MNERYMMVTCFEDETYDKYYERFFSTEQAVEVCKQILRQEVFWQDSNTNKSINNIKIYRETGEHAATVTYDTTTNAMNVIKHKY